MDPPYYNDENKDYVSIGYTTADPIHEYQGLDHGNRDAHNYSGRHSRGTTPRPQRPANGARKKKQNKESPKKCCSAPPWWAWVLGLIGIAVVGVLTAFLLLRVIGEII